MKKFYAEKAILGRDRTTVIYFDGKKERDEYVKTHDHINSVPASKGKYAVSLQEYENFRRMFDTYDPN